MEPSDQQHGSIDPLRMQANQSLTATNGPLEVANSDGEVGVATPHSSAIHTQLEESDSFDGWKAIVLSHFTDGSAVLPF